MPECLDCGNKDAFVHEVEGTETRIYSDETGEFLHVESKSLETTALRCDECGSANVEVH